MFRNTYLYFSIFIIIKFSDFRLDWLTDNKLYYNLLRKKFKGFDYNICVNDLLLFDKTHSQKQFVFIEKKV